MAYITISNWVTTDWTDEMEAMARDKFTPLIMGCGAEAVHMVRTGDNSFTVMTHYSSEAAATEAQEKIAAIRAQAADELPMTMESRADGVRFAGS